MTLIEVILATSILCVGLATLLTGAARCVAVMKTSRQYQEAQWAMTAGEVEHRVAEIDDVMEYEVDPVEYGEGYMFSRTVEEDEDEDELYVVRTRVTWSRRGGEASEEVVRYVWHEE